MKLDSKDWLKLRTPLVILGVTLVVIALMLVFVQNYSNAEEKLMQAQQNLLSTARQRYQSSGLEKETISEYLPQYQVLITKGFVGEERRIEWVEALREQHKKNKLFGIKYSISQQEEYKPSFLPSLGGFALHRSIMKLDLDMLHEGDILQLTESLNAENAAPFMLRDCEITRLNAGGALGNQLVANLHAQCELDWLTMREPASIQAPLVP